jgi:tetratricopeptide (TPR) repeat protein
LGLILSQTEPETVFNALRLANYTLEQGDGVKVFLIGKGVELDKINDPKFWAAAELDPRNVDVLITFAEFLDSLRRFNDAEVMLDRVLQISPGDESALATKAFEFQDEGRLDEAAEELSKVAANSQEDQVAAARSLQFVYERRFDEAVASVKSAAAPDFATDPPHDCAVGLLAGMGGTER